MQTGIPWSPTFDIETDRAASAHPDSVWTPPTYVLSPTYQASQSCSYAVCYGVRILTPTYLRALLGAIASSWKQVADSQDSFTFPNELAEEFQPDFDAKLQKYRRGKPDNPFGAWLPDPTRRQMFAGWNILLLRGDVVRVTHSKRQLQELT